MYATARLPAGERCTVCRLEFAPCLTEVRDSISGETFSVLRCPGCGNAMTVPRPRPKHLADYYGTRYYGGRHGFTARLCVWRRTRRVKQSVGAAAPAMLLDVGCGEGEFLEAMRESAWTAAGVEMRTHRKRDVFGSLEEAAERGHYRCITLWHVLEHVPDPARHLAELRSMLSDDGVLMIAVPDFGGLQARLFGRHWLHLDVPRHLHHFTRRGLMHLLRRAGFETVRVANQELEYDWFGWIQSALNMILGTPNVLFDSLTGKARRVSVGQVALSYVLGAMMALPALVLTLASSAARCGGTLVVTARPAARKVVKVAAKLAACES